VLAEQLANTVLDFVRQHPNWALCVVFVLAFAEFVPFVWVSLVAIGPLVGAAHPLLFWAAVLTATVGAALSDWFLYWLGHRFHEQVQTMWPLKNHPGALHSGRTFFKRWGMWAIFVGRFAGPFRASVPIVAGVSEMPIVPFQLANWASALAWGLILLSPGALGAYWFMQSA
jgi:membrane protein DedA with SNARE-associated domain